MKKLFHLHLSKFGCFKKNCVVSRRVMLVALLSLLTLPIIAETSKRIGVFFVSDKKVVSFAPGNLQHEMRPGGWMFASEQYEMLGVSNVTGGSVTTDPAGYGKENKTGTALANKIDLFGWSAQGAVNKAPFGVSIANIDSYYAGEFLDWGNNVINGDASNTWRTLTFLEWDYLRFNRLNANNLIAVARIDFAGVPNANGDAYVNGLILLPDNWEEVKVDCSSRDKFIPGFHTNASNKAHENDFYNHGVFINIAEWKEFEKVGAVFLPAGGYRDKNNNDPEKSVTAIYNTRYMGQYWTATPISGDNQNSYAFKFNSSGAQQSVAAPRYNGRSVRLVCDTLPVKVTLPIDKVTSSAGQTVKVRIPITLSSLFGMKGNSPTTIEGTSDNPAFSVVALKDVVPGEQVLIVEYKPTATADGIETATITLTSTTLQGSTSFKITGRHLPEKFAVISKVGNQWYAMPSTAEDVSSAGVQVVVNDNDDPTQVTLDPENISWSLKQSKRSPTDDRFILTNPNGFCLSARNGTLQIDTEYNSTFSSSTSCEWLPASADLKNYELKNVGNQKYLSISEQKIFSSSNNNASVVRLVPIAEIKQSDIQVVEWYPTKVLLYTKDYEYINNNTTVVYIDNEAQPSVKVIPVGRNLVELSGITLIQLAGKQLTIHYSKGSGYSATTYGQTITIPVIISRQTYYTSTGLLNSINSNDYNHLDLVVRDGATLIINTSDLRKNTFQNVFIHPTAKIVVPQGGTLIVNSLTFWGGIDEIFAGLLLPYSNKKYEVPQLELKGSLQKTKAAIDYIMRVDLEQMYSLALPYDVAFADITYWDGEAMTPGTQLYVSTYNGQARANLDMKNTWLYETEFPDQKLTAGVGYTISAEPQADENSTLPMDSYALIRMPMKNNLTAEGTEQAKTVAATAYANQNGVTISDNHKGWNLVGNPFLTDISSDMNEDQIVLGHLKETGTGPWEWVDDDVRYVTIPSDDGTYYRQDQFKNVILKPFKNFFVQIANTGELSFALSCRKNAPARYLLNDMEQETELEILLSGADQSDHTGFLVSEQYSLAYEINADLEKMVGAMSLYSIYGGYSLAYNALSWTDAEQQISLGYCLPETGEYTLSMRENALIDSVQHVYLTDHVANVVVDLLDGEYQFISQVKENEDRFTIQLIRKDEIDNTITNIDDTEKYNNCTQKLYYQGQLFIMHQGNIYNTLGQKVTKH